jgi:hypothetical protein
MIPFSTKGFVQLTVTVGLLKSIWGFVSTLNPVGSLGATRKK